MKILEMNEISGEPQELKMRELAESQAGFTLVRSWEIDEDTRVFEWRSDRNHLSVECHFINEAADWETSTRAKNEAYTVLTTAYAILNNLEQ